MNWQNNITWVEESVVIILHDELITEYGGIGGIRDPGLLESALFRPKNLANYSSPDITDLAAAYGYGLIRNHPFIDGNKRIAFTITVLFLALNRKELIADDSTCVIIMLKLADGSLSEKEFADWLRDNIKPIT